MSKNDNDITGDQQQLRKLFDQLDKNKDGKIDFKELSEFYGSLNTGTFSKADNDSKIDAYKLFESITSSNEKSSVNFDFNDFMEYVSQKDKKIRIFFNHMDKDNNGIIDRNEIKKGFEELGIILKREQVEKLLHDMDNNGELEIDWREWRDFFRFAPHDKLEEMLRYWRSYSFANYSIPQDYTENEKQTGLWWRNLVSGGVAGAVSRTCTAPLDRVKIFFQVFIIFFHIIKKNNVVNLTFKVLTINRCMEQERKLVFSIL